MAIRVMFVDDPSGRATCKICKRVIGKDEKALCFIGKMIKFYTHFNNRECDREALLMEGYAEIKGWDR